jgi:hypothetical protein
VPGLTDGVRDNLRSEARLTTLAHSSGHFSVPPVRDRGRCNVQLSRDLGVRKTALEHRFQFANARLGKSTGRRLQLIVLLLAARLSFRGC